MQARLECKMFIAGFSKSTEARLLLLYAPCRSTPLYANDDVAIQRSLPIRILRSKVKDDSADDLVDFCAPAS